ELRRPFFSLYDPSRREDERAPRHGVPGSRRNRQQHPLLSQPAHPRRCPYPDSRNDREWEIGVFYISSGLIQFRGDLFKRVTIEQMKPQGLALDLRESSKHLA